MKRSWLVLVGVVLVVGLGFSQTTVRIMGFGGIDQNIVEELIAKFVTPKLKGIKVVYEPVQGDYQQVLLNSLSAGTVADLFYMDIFWAQNVIKSGRVEPLDSYLANSKILKKGDIIPSLINAFTVDGKVYGIPKDFNTLALFYNKDIFDEAGVAYPNENDTWDTLEAKLKQVKAKVKGVEGMALAPDFARMGAFAYANGWDPIVNDASNLEDARFVEAFKWYTGLKQKGLGVMPGDIGQGWGGGAFATEKVAVCLEGAWILGFLKDNAPNLKYGATLLPKSPKTKERGNFIFTVAWGISANSKVKKEAFQVLELLTSPEAQQFVLERGLALPSRKALVDNPYFKKNEPAAQANYVVFRGASDKYVKPFFFDIYGGEWMGPINTAMTEVMSGQKAADKAIKDANAQLAIKMKELRQKSR
ncbi:MAG: ABC transporter substrate-binding protein [Brevinematales bacterium]|nr:ABC transporter substrate-binding protein [Brevinematales bacterium]